MNYMQKYYLEHKDEYIQRNKKHCGEKIKCEICNKYISYHYKWKHDKTKIHQENKKLDSETLEKIILDTLRRLIDY